MNDDQTGGPLPIPETIAVGNYIEQLHGTEQQWITNRLSWLFVSQSFCLTAFSILRSSAISDKSLEAEYLLWMLPVVGIVVSATVGLSVYAANRVSSRLADCRSQITTMLNRQLPGSVQLPLLGAHRERRDPQLIATRWQGALPQHLPWLLALVWAIVLICRIASLSY